MNRGSTPLKTLVVFLGEEGRPTLVRPHADLSVQLPDPWVSPQSGPLLNHCRFLPRCGESQTFGLHKPVNDHLQLLPV